jgi:hypothetical protein
MGVLPDGHYEGEPENQSDDGQHDNN